MNIPEIENLGLVEYKKAWEYQETLFEKEVNTKIHGDPQPGYILVCEHPHVYTLGKHGEQANLLITDEFLKSINASFFRIDRGGDITYHGPGQIVCYPIIDLDLFGLGIRSYIEKLEASVISTLKSFDMGAYRLPGITGVWMKDRKTGQDKKICAIGVRASRGITMHGLALNVNTDLSYFKWINPCGYSDKGVTSMQEQTGTELPMKEVSEILLSDILRELNF